MYNETFYSYFFKADYLAGRPDGENKGSSAKWIGGVV